MKFTMSLIVALLLACSSYCQKNEFVGMYATPSNYDTQYYVHMSYDSVKLICYVKTEPDFWFVVKCGTWAIKDYQEKIGYNVVFQYNDGTQQYIKFRSVYSTRPVGNKPPPPDSYDMHIGKYRISRIYGNSSLMSMGVFNVESQQKK